MIGKLLLTSLVIAIAVVFIRERRRAGRKAASANTSGGTPGAATAQSANKELRTAAYLFLLLMAGIASVMYYLRWQDDHRILTVTLFSSSGAPPVSYQVYRYQLSSRSFITTNGTHITVADSDRMEIQGLP
jgi:Na+/H+ antiporter NhaC